MRYIVIKIFLGVDVLFLIEFDGCEELLCFYEYEFLLLLVDDDVDLMFILG